MTELGERAEMRRRTFLGLFAAFGAAAVTGIDLGLVDEAIAEEISAPLTARVDVWVRRDDEWLGIGRLLSGYVSEEHEYPNIVLSSGMRVRGIPPIRSARFEFELEQTPEQCAVMPEIGDLGYLPLRIDMCGHRFECERSFLSEVRHSFVREEMTTSGCFMISSEPKMSLLAH